MFYFLKIFQGKINYNSIFDSVGISMPARQTREFPAFSVRSASKHSPSARRVTADNDVYIYLDI
jgi:hypothetical protein